MKIYRIRLVGLVMALFFGSSCTPKGSQDTTSTQNKVEEVRPDIAAVHRDDDAEASFIPEAIPTIEQLAGPPVTTFFPSYPLQPGGSGGNGRGTRREGERSFIIVGNGTAGAVLARKLSDPKTGPQNTVLVLEAGENYNNDPIALDPNATFGTPNAIILSNPPYAFVFPLLVNGVLSALTTSAGKGFGGSSMHNFMTAVRPTPSVFNFWATFSQDDRWGYNTLLPTIRAVENYSPNETVANYTQRGDRGATSIIQLTPPIITDPFLNNIATVGPTAVGLVNDFNDPSEGTVGISAPQRFNTPAPNRMRSFSSRDYLEAVVDSGGNGLGGRRLKIQSGAFVSRVLFDGSRAIGVEYFFESAPNTLLKAFADQIILTAGALNTPAILERSGIGDPGILEPLGIAVLVNNPNVGNNLQNHYGATARMTGGAQPMPTATGFTDLRGQGAYTADGIRRMQMNISTVAGNVNQFNGVILNPKSRGSVHIVSANPSIQPQVDHAVYTDGPLGQFESDAHVIVSYLRYIKQFADQNGRTMIAPPPADYASDATLFAYASATPAFQAHQVGTTRMASSPAQGVVDGRLNVFGVENLMVADIGIEPQTSDGNTAYSAFVIGLEAARILGVDIFNN